MPILCRRVAEFFGRVFVLTEIFIFGLLNTIAEGLEMLFSAIFSIVHVNISNSMECKKTGIFSHNNK